MLYLVVRIKLLFSQNVIPCDVGANLFVKIKLKLLVIINETDEDT